MKVITLHEPLFLEHCRQLEQTVSADYVPDLVVAIATGGVYVAENMFPDVPHLAVKCKRPSTAVKERHQKVFSIIKQLPTCLRNWLRKMESLMLRRKSPDRNIEVEIKPIDRLTTKKILIIDDAVDSGSTLKAVLEKMREQAPQADIRSAVITVTTKHPDLRPDYALYDNQTLIRFPWSKDYRPEK